MSELKKQKVFGSKLNSDLQPKGDDLDSKLSPAFLNEQQLFEEKEQFYPQEISVELEQEIEEIVKPKKSRWLMKATLVSFLGLTIWQTIDSTLTNLQTGNWLGFGWGAFVMLIASVGLGAIIREVVKLRSLKNKLSVHEKAEKIIELGSTQQALQLCESISAQENRINKVENLPFEAWKNQVTNQHSAEEVFQIYDSTVLAEKDKQAEKLIARYSSEAALMVALSPLAVADMLLVGWRNIALLNRLTEIYGIELGYWSRLKLIKSILVHMAAAGASELAIDAGADALSMDLTAKVSARAAQGIGVGILTARLAIRTVSLIRPLTWSDSEQIKLADIRKALVTNLKSKL